MSIALLRACVAVGLVGSVAAAPAAGRAQRVHLYDEPTVCSTPFQPVSGVTFHAGGQWRITWSTEPGQYSRAIYQGTPNPTFSTDATKKWQDPTADVTCWIRWYETSGGREADYDWHVVDYGGTVTDCGSSYDPTHITSGPGADYDPYAASGGGDGCDGADGGSGTAPPDCSDEYVYVEESNDGGVTWTELWEGWAEVCG